jgi:3-dehydroquinate synthase
MRPPVGGNGPGRAPEAPITLRAGGREVPLLAGPGALERLPEALSAIGVEGRVWVVADRRAAELHGGRLAAVLPEAPLLRISGDERDKTLDQAERVWTWLIEQGAQRRDVVVAFGGGVVCDLVGFVAACFLRGVGLVNAPTTLLAQVDASVGGKTGVNHRRGKNLIGAFYQPLAVVADTALLATLDRRAFAAGMAEVAKIAMAMDARLFERLETAAAELAPTAAERLGPFVARAVELKAGVVERDERETGERLLLNYGHTIGHALEAASAYGTLLHGEAVAIGMRGAAHIAHELGMLGSGDADRQRRVLADLGLPRACPAVGVEAVLGRLVVDKKRVGARQRWVLAERVGQARVCDDVPEPLVREAVELVLS